MSNKACLLAVHRLCAVGHGKDDRRRAAGQGDRPAEALALVHVACAARRRAWMAWTIILSAAPRFEKMIANGEFLECADVFGNLYGTHAGDTSRCLESGDDVVLVIDVQGARKVRAAGLPHVAIFVLPPSYDVLEQPASRPQQGQRRGDTQAARGGARRGVGVRGVRLRGHQRRARVVRRAHQGRSCWRSARSSSACARRRSRF